MTQAKSGDTIRIHYIGKLTDGTEFDSSNGRAPLEFVVGAGQIIAGLDREIDGMELGTHHTVTVPAEEAYGAHDPAKVHALPRTAVPSNIDVHPGLQLQTRTPDGNTIPLVVTEVSDQVVTVDANHPLAGKDLVFDVELVEIVRAA